jgi:hypothetical protein
LTIFFFCKRLRMLFSKNATCCKNVNNVFLRFVSKCEMWSRDATSDFFSCRKYFCELVLVIMLDHLIVYDSIVWLEFFRNDERDLIRFFEMTKAWRSDLSDLTKATHQTWRKRLIKFDTSNLIKFDESDSSSWIRAISSNLTSRLLIKSDRRHLVKHDELYLIKSDESDSSNLTKETSSHQVERARHLIKLFEKKDNFFIFWWAILQWHLMWEI